MTDSERPNPVLRTVLMLLECPHAIVEDPDRVVGMRCTFIAQDRSTHATTVRAFEVVPSGERVVLHVEPFTVHGRTIDRIARDREGWHAMVEEPKPEERRTRIAGYPGTVRFSGQTLRSPHPAPGQPCSGS